MDQSDRTDVADFKLVKRVLLTSDTIDCEAFGGCEIYRVKFPIGQSAHAYLLAQRDNQVDPLGAVIRAAIFNVAGFVRNRLNPDEPAGRLPQHPVSNETSYIVTIENDAPKAVDMQIAVINEETPSQARSLCHAQASPVPIKLDDLQVTVTATEITITTEWRRYRIRGLERNNLPGVMKINILVYNERTERFHVDCFDLYHARSRRMFTMEAADEIGAEESQLRSDLGRVLLRLEQLQAAEVGLGRSTWLSSQSLGCMKCLRDRWSGTDRQQSRRTIDARSCPRPEELAVRRKRRIRRTGRSVDELSQQCQASSLGRMEVFERRAGSSIG